MKVFEIHGGICHRHAVEYQTAEETQGRYPPDFVFVDAPDEVFEGWGYLDGEFIKPTPPEGWLYDDKTGTFYPVDAEPPKRPPTVEELEAEIVRLQEEATRIDNIEVYIINNVFEKLMDELED